MEQQSKGQPDNRDQKIAELEAKLMNAHQVIDNLQQKNLELQKFIHDSQTGVNSNSSLPTKNTKYQTKQPQSRKSNHSRNGTDYKSRFSQLSQFQFYGITFLVAILIVGLFRLFIVLTNQEKENNKNPLTNNTSSIPTKLVKPSPNSISIAPGNIPVEKQPLSVNQLHVPSSQSNLEVAYNVATPPELTKSDSLQKIVNDLVTSAKDKKLPTEPLSITLIDVSNKKIAEYHSQKPRYPASVVKLFWMVAFEAQIKQNSNSAQVAIDNDDLRKMILQSDNNASSRILDQITNTQSSPQNIEPEKFKQWKEQRQKVNLFFQKAGYKDINISQKTFPIPDLQITEPKGPDLQIRGDNPQKPKRNKITTYQAARLMYEIVTGQALDAEYSQTMIRLLTRDLRREAWKLDPPNPDEFNPIENFFGESLSGENVKFVSKAGWTNSSRQEVAYIETQDGKTRYILAVFGDDPAYGASKKIFPEMSRIVFKQMKNR